MLRSSADENMVMQVRFRVTVDAVGETHDLTPTPSLVSVQPTSPIAHDQCTVLKVVNRRRY
jgi:hypothetical protein